MEFVKTEPSKSYEKKQITQPTHFADLSNNRPHTTSATPNNTATYTEPDFSELEFITPSTTSSEAKVEPKPVTNAAPSTSEQNGDAQLTHCKKCKNDVPAHFMFCPYCKKRLHKRPRKKWNCKVPKGAMITIVCLSISTISLLGYSIWLYNGVYLTLYHKYIELYDSSIDKSVEKNKVVYWVETGKVYHTRSDCPALSKSKAEKRSGTIATAQKRGKPRACSVCK